MLKELIRYTEIADLKIIQTFIDCDQSLPEAEALFSHMLNAQHIWISRIKQEPQVYDRFDLHPANTYLDLHRKQIAQMYALEASDLNYTVSYSNSQGEKFKNKALDILYHLVNHSTYHRGQVATQFRLNKIQPPVTDFIFFKRENLL